jgi:hypothetical protein
MRVTKHVVLAQEVEHRAQFFAALSRGSTPLIPANDVAAGGSECRFLDGGCWNADSCLRLHARSQLCMARAPVRRYAEIEMVINKGASGRSPARMAKAASISRLVLVHLPQCSFGARRIGRNEEHGNTDGLGISLWRSPCRLLAGSLLRGYSGQRRLLLLHRESSQ